MKVFIAGATGVLGRHLVRQFAARGHRVVGLAFVGAAEAGAHGLCHVTDDRPVTVKEMLEKFAALLGAKPPRRVPFWLARPVAGSYAVQFFTSSTRTSNARFRRDTGWSPQFPSYCEGRRQVVSVWKAERSGV